MRYVDDVRATLHAVSNELAPLMERMRRSGTAADEIGDIPEGFFDGIDVRQLNCAHLPPEFGGQAMLQDSVTRCVLSEVLGYADPALAVALPGPSLALSPLLELGNDEQRREVFGRFDDPRPVWGAFAITEPGGGSDATHLATRAWREGAGYRLVGEKCFIGNGGRASFWVVFATTDPGRGQFGIQPFLVDPHTPGLLIDDTWPMLGLRAVRVSHLRLDDCWIPEERLLGQLDGRVSARAFLSAQRSWEYMRPALSSLIVGALERLLDDLGRLAAEEGDSRFRQTTAALVERVRPQTGSARLLAHHAAALFDAGEVSSVTSSMAKTAAAKLARVTVDEALIALGATPLGEHGIARDVARWARDFQGFELLEGTNEVHQLMIARGWSARARRRRQSVARRAECVGTSQHLSSEGARGA